MDQQVPTEASAEVGMLIHPTRDWYFSIWILKLALDYFSRTYFHLFMFEKAAWPISEPTYFANYSATRYKPKM